MPDKLDHEYGVELVKPSIVQSVIIGLKLGTAGSEFGTLYGGSGIKY